MVFGSLQWCDAAKTDIVDILAIRRGTQVYGEGPIVGTVLPVATTDETVAGRIRIGADTAVVIDPTDPVSGVPGRV